MDVSQKSPSQQFGHTQEEIEEIKRRAQWTYDPSSAASNDAVVISEKSSPPFEIPNQKYILVNLGHVDQRMRSNTPCFRILGAFATMEDLREHCETLTRDVSIIKVDRGRIFLICESGQKQLHPRYAIEKIRRITDRHRDEFDRRQQDFEDRRQKIRESIRSGTEVESELKEVTNHSEPVVPKLLETETRNPKNLSRLCEVRKQSVAVVSIFRDDQHLCGAQNPEPGIIIWGLFEDSETAKAWIQNEAQSRVTTCHLDVVDCYEWLHPQDVDVEKVTEVYRSKGLTAVMQKRKDHPRTVAMFKDQVRARQASIPFQPFRQMRGDEKLEEIEESGGKTEIFEVKVNPEHLSFEELQKMSENPELLESAILAASSSTPTASMLSETVRGSVSKQMVEGSNELGFHKDKS